MSQVIFEVSVNVIGVKKRCRNSDRHSIKIAKIDFKELSAEDVEKFTDIAKEAVKTNMRQFPANAVLQFTKMEIGEHFLTCLLFDPANKSFSIQL